ncbi:MAG: nuclear transport factor 2 family protein [Pyrinomonadaceae bacterium]
MMNTNDTVKAYFERLSRREAWQDLIAENFVFTSFVSPVKKIVGKEDFLVATERFYSSIRTVEITARIVDGAKACALTCYELSGPGGSFNCHVAEIFSVSDGSITSLDIYFDSRQFPS